MSRGEEKMRKYEEQLGRIGHTASVHGSGVLQLPEGQIRISGSGYVSEEIIRVSGSAHLQEAEQQRRCTLQEVSQLLEP